MRRAGIGEMAATVATMTFVSRLLLLAGAGGIALAALLPWVTIGGLTLDLGIIGAEVSPGARTVSGTDTSYWPVLLGAGALVAVLALLNVARRLLIVVGAVAIAAGGALLYYVSNAVEIAAEGRSVVEQALANTLISSSAGAGPPLLMASGAAIVIGALLA